MPIRPSLFDKIMKALRVPNKNVKPYDARTFVGPELPLNKQSYTHHSGKYQDLDDIMDIQADEGYFCRYSGDGFGEKDNYFTRYKDMGYGRVPESMKKKAKWSVDPKVAKKLGMELPDADVVKYGDRWLAPQYKITPIGRRNMEYQYDAGLLNDFRKEQKANIDYWKNTLGMTDEDIMRVYNLNPSDIE